MNIKGKQGERGIFVWRGQIHWGYEEDYDHDSVTEYGIKGMPDLYAKRFELCPFCQTIYESTSDRGSRRCTICGFACSYEGGGHHSEGSNIDYNWFTVSKIKEYPLSSQEITFAELAEHLRRRDEDYYILRPRRFEELIADVYKNLGYRVQLTQQTCDGGADILLLNKDGEQEIVECKRYAKSRKVSVSVVRSVLGVMVYKGVNRASIVSTSQFSGPAGDFANGVHNRLSEISISLVDASELVKSLDIYRADLPPLHLNPVLDKIQRVQEAFEADP